MAPVNSSTLMFRDYLEISQFALQYFQLQATDISIPQLLTTTYTTAVQQ